MGGRTGQLALITRVARAPELRRIQLAFAVFAISEHASWLATLFFALERGGGAEVGMAAIAMLMPAVVLTPFSSYAGDRFSPRRALAVGYGVQSLAMAVTAAAMWADAPLVVYASAAGAATAVSFTRPVMGSLLPTVTHAPSDLVAGNVVMGLIEQVGLFVGPLLAGLVLALTSPAAVFAMTALFTAAACTAIFGVRADTDDRVRHLGAGDALHVALAGFATLRRLPRLRILVAMVAIAGVVKGVGDYAFVVFAEERLSGGGGIAGALAGCYGIGGLAGALSAARLARASGVSRSLIGATVLLVVALLATTVVDQLPLALLAVAMLGAGESLLLVTTMVCIQRQAPSDVLARVFGIVEGTLMGMIGFGTLMVSLLVRHLSLGSSLAVVAAAIATSTVLAIGLLRLNGDEPEPVGEAIVDRLLIDPLFAPLSAPTIERLARNVERRSFAPGESIIVEGDRGDRYYLVVDGTLDVSRDGQHLRALEAGMSFGEIALLHEVARTASVTAVTVSELLSVERDDFLEAITGHSRALSAARRVVDDFLDDDDHRRHTDGHQ